MNAPTATSTLAKQSEQPSASLAAFVLRIETAKNPVAVARSYYLGYQFERSLKEIAEGFRATDFGKVVEAEGLSVEALYTKHDQGPKSSLSLTIQEGISYYIPVPDFYFDKEDGTVGFSEWYTWSAWKQEAPKLLRWLARVRKMLSENIWLPETE